MPSEHKAVILEVLSESLRQDRSAPQTPQEERAWNEVEETSMRDFLSNKPALGWQHADELVVALASRLQRTPSEIRRKAVELGLGVSVDYGLARWAARTGKS